MVWVVCGEHWGSGDVWEWDEWEHWEMGIIGKWECECGMIDDGNVDRDLDGGKRMVVLGILVCLSSTHKTPPP